MYSKAESSLLEPISKYVKRKGFRWLYPELQFYEYRIDLYGFSRTLDLTIAIEMKIKNWKRAFQQAIVYQLCADIVFVAMPLVNCHRIDSELLHEYGVGIIAISDEGRCSEYLPPKNQGIVKSNYRKTYIDIVLGGHL